MKNFLLLIGIVIIVAVIAGAIAYFFEARTDSHYRDNAKITREQAIQAATQYVQNNMSKDAFGYPKDINTPYAVRETARSWNIGWHIREERAFPNTKVISVDKISGKARFVPQR